MTIPHYNTWLKCVNIDTKNSTALVRSNKTGKCFPVTLNKDIKYLVSKGDHLHVVKSHVNKEWIAIDYNAMTAVGDDDE